jgi:type II secretory pathway component PulC
MSNSIAGDPSLYSAVSDRTIFVSNRHLPPAAIVKDADEPGVAEVATNFPFTLLGVMITQDKKIAVIKRDGDTEIMSLQVGQSLDAWTIEDIKNNHIILQSGDDKKSLSLADEKKNGAAQP